MKKLLIAILAAHLLAGCASSPSTFVGDRDNKEVIVTWVRVDPIMVGTVCGDVTGKRAPTSLMPYRPGVSDQTDMFGPRGCATFGVNSLGKPFCTIYASIPQSDYGIEILGHEVLHCFIGNWHP